MKGRCAICQARSPFGMCDPCGRSYDRARRRDDGSILAALTWAARRARRIAKREVEQSIARRLQAAARRAARVVVKIPLTRTGALR